jgi:hypothetical protein
MFLLGSAAAVVRGASEVRAGRPGWLMACARAVRGTAPRNHSEDGGCGLCERPRDHGSLGSGQLG